jgi:hypothetical protein
VPVEAVFHEIVERDWKFSVIVAAMMRDLDLEPVENATSGKA